jgi:non-ribosomal peptide synthetase component F
LDGSSKNGKLVLSDIAVIFEKIAKSHENKAAVLCEESCMTYCELNEAANQLARHILKVHGGKMTGVP